MKVKTRPVLASLSVVVLVLALAASAADAGGAMPYRRWISPKTLTCQPNGSGGVEANIDNQNVEFNDLPADAQYTINYVRNGVETTSGPFTVEQTTGTKNYAGFTQSFPSYPFTFLFRLDTIINGVVVYTSTLDLSCTGDDDRVVSATNQVPPTTTTSTSTSSTSSSTSTTRASSTTSTTSRVNSVVATPRFTG